MKARKPRTSPTGMKLLRAVEAHERQLATIKAAEHDGDPEAARVRIAHEARTRVALAVLGDVG